MCSPSLYQEGKEGQEDAPGIKSYNFFSETATESQFSNKNHISIEIITYLCIFDGLLIHII